ncbi:hypothetical protein V1L54_25030 [Streptomyces sp. TRM 70361]|uniref:hypothetical protein n=1 Tax=Streptomyces sp. TRM 70361 TaxID=3116553 RepID=UPI002E7C4BC6|nr:hypothetical protein [Streptomyces sp. TRM 70361]MEE1942629.1 hypothetical protein [Streptomyces sp. TRM 70361]
MGSTKRTKRRIASVLAAGCAAGLIPAATAAADSPAPAPAPVRGAAPEPWEPYVDQGFTAPAGYTCAFPLKATPLEQDMVKRVLERHPGGAVKREEYKGPLVVEYENTDTGATVVRDVGGHGFPEYRADGRLKRYLAVGPVGFGMRDGDDFPKGFWIVDGVHVAEFAEDGTRGFSVRMGPEENVCAALDG